jgi:hypothetical protein
MSPRSALSPVRSRAIVAYFGLSGAAALAALIALIMIPADPKNSILLGFSLQRLALMGVMLVLLIICSLAARKSWRSDSIILWIRTHILEKPRVLQTLLVITGFLFIAGWIALNLPLYRFGRLQSYFVRLNPLLAWAAFTSGLTCVYLLAYRHGLHWQTIRTMIAGNKKTLLITALLFAGFLLVWVFMVVTGRGIRAEENHWYESGVPLLGLQLLAALGISLLVYWLDTKVVPTFKSTSWWVTRLDVLIFIVVWGVTAIFWASEPLQPSYFSPGPYYPNQEFAPYSDAASFDLKAQFAWIGQGLDNGRFLDRGFYSAFLVFLHAAAGDDYSPLMAIQAALYAILPAALYLIGKAIYGRPLGIFLAVLGAARGINSIASANMINSANPKMMMTDFPTAVLLALFTAAVVFWFLKPRTKWTAIILAGGTVGVASLLRTNALFVLPGVLAAGFLIYSKPRGLYLAAVAVLLGSTLLTVLPWSIRNDRLFDNAFFSIYTRRVEMVDRSRFRDVTPRASQAPQTATGENEQKPLATIDPRIRKYMGVAGVASIHFLHNLSGSVLILPTSTAYHDLANTVSMPYWDPAWDGRNIPGGELLGLAGNLILIALGISLAWRRSGIAGIIPLLIFLTYHATNALARTSGGRYLVPVDWVLVIYFGLGLLQLVLWSFSIFSNAPLEIRRQPEAALDPARTSFMRQALPMGLLMAAMLGVGLMPVLAESIFPRQFEQQTNLEVLNSLLTRDSAIGSIVNVAEMEDFLTSENAVAYRGKLLYPRYFFHNDGIPARWMPYATLEYPRLAFTMVGAFGSRGVILPLAQPPEYIENGVEVMMIGCRGDGVTQAALLWISSDQTVYQRDPSAPLQCPLPAPVCDDNRNCR